MTFVKVILQIKKVGDVREQPKWVRDKLKNVGLEFKPIEFTILEIKKLNERKEWNRVFKKIGLVEYL